MAKSEWTESSLFELIRGKYPPDRFGVLRHVPDGTSGHKSRTADAVAMGLWKSVGFYLHGFEIKVSRADWQKELNDIHKSAAIGKFCNYWWIVAPDGIVCVDEMPSDWGLLCPRGNGLKVVKAATRREAEQVDAPFLASCFRQIQSQCDETRIRDDIRHEVRKEWAENRQREIDMATKAAKSERDALQKRVDNFESKSGVRIDLWNSGDIGLAVATLLKWHGRGPDRRFEEMKETASEIVAMCESLERILGEVALEKAETK